MNRTARLLVYDQTKHDLKDIRDDGYEREDMKFSAMVVSALVAEITYLRKRIGEE